MKARNSTEQWHRDNDYKWMNDDQWACFEMLCDLCGGAHHISGKVKPFGRGIAVNSRCGFHAATFDYNGLTRAVILAHDRCIRLEILPSGPGMLKLAFSKRHGRDGDFSRRHPTLEEAIETIRGITLPVQSELTGAQWSAARKVFEEYANKVNSADKYEMASAYLDAAPQAIYDAILAAQEQK